MCEIVSREKRLKGGKFDLFLTCKKTGKQINKTNEFGMYCDEFCDMDKDKEAKALGDKLIKSFLEERGVYE